MKILIVKMSSMGDVVHAFPALVDAIKENPGIEFDWVVEEGFADIASFHPYVNKVIPIAIRRWRKNWLKFLANGEISKFVRNLRISEYDLIIDSQGLIKSALVARIAKGPVGGFDRNSARESLASSTYAQSHEVAKNLHAVERQRILFAGLLQYEVEGSVNYGLCDPDSATESTNAIMLLHGTTWASKLWPESYWRSLCKILLEAGHEVLIPAGNKIEKERAQSIAENTTAKLLEPMGLKELMLIMANCKGAVSVDTGLGHLACALNIPLISLYGATDPALTGIEGPRQLMIVSDHLPCIPCKERNCRYGLEDNSSKIYPPCFQQSTPESVWLALQLQINKAPQTGEVSQRQD